MQMGRIHWTAPKNQLKYSHDDRKRGCVVGPNPIDSESIHSVSAPAARSMQSRVPQSWCSIKDRAALASSCRLKKTVAQPGVYHREGTAGNTGIGLATIAARALQMLIVMPNNQAEEKYVVIKHWG